MKAIELPPLPETEYSLCFHDEGGMQELDKAGYTEDDMQAYARAAVEANNVPEFCDPSCTTYDVAAMVMSDCGHSTNNQRLLDRVAERIDKHLSAMLSASPAPAQQERKPMTYREIADATGDWAHVQSDYIIGIVRAVERHHGIREQGCT